MAPVATTLKDSSSSSRIESVNNDGTNRHGVNNGHNDAMKSLYTAQSVRYAQTPVAVVGMACRLPDECSNAQKFWEFIQAGRTAKNTPPLSRYDIKTHYDGTLRNKTMASPGGMYLQNVDPRDMDAQFFKLSRLEAISMDPQQRQLLEVVYEGLENAGVTLEELHDASVGCFVASFANDYGDMQARDPEDRAAATVIGNGRAMLSNRISHFLNIKGPSMTIDTACSGSFVGLDVAMRYLNGGEISGAIIAGCNLYMSPEWVMDHHMGANGTASLTGKCHTFDAKADGYIKAEAVNMVYLRRLDDAIREGLPIRGIIRGTATNSDGWTAGIASPSSEAQARAIRAAYRNAGISDLSQTSYVECHGTGTRAGDVIEAKGVAAVFGEFHTAEKPLRIGSVKANVGHSEPSAGITGLLKVLLSLEKGVIPGTPTFISPNPNLDFAALHVLPSRATTKWPVVPFKRASVNSFGYGGSNAHAVVDAAEGLSAHVSSYKEESTDLFGDDDEEVSANRSYIVALSANDDVSLKSQLAALDRHLSDPSVGVELRDLAYTLSEKRTKHYHRGFLITNSSELDTTSFTQGTVKPEAPKLGFVFTGQGAQWVQMGKDLIETFPVAAETVNYLDTVLRGLPDAPSWTIYDELTKAQASHRMKLPELSQPLCSALQIAILAVLETAGVKPVSVIGHSSGEIAAAVASGRLTAAQAIKIAYYRGAAAAEATYTEPVGMLAVGVGSDQVAPYLEGTDAEIACYNSPSSVTVSGTLAELELVDSKLKADSIFARMLQVNAAYHSRHMSQVADRYLTLLQSRVEWPKTKIDGPTWFSSTKGKVVDSVSPGYWVANMVSPVLFSQAATRMLTEPEPANCLVEIGPSNALSGPLNQVKQSLSKAGVDYIPMWKRGADALPTFLGSSGRLFTMGYPISLAAINADSEIVAPRQIIDLPNYSWNHTTKYWHESAASKDWRYRKFPNHELLGGKVLGSPWDQPVFKKILKLSESPWLRDHTLDDNVIFPAAGYLAMAVEAIYQKTVALERLPADTPVNACTYKLRNVSFFQALPLEDGDKDTHIMLALNPDPSTKDSWHEFKITSVSRDVTTDHCKGRVRISNDPIRQGTEKELAPFKFADPAPAWYKSMREVGYAFGPSFQRLVEVESTAGRRDNRAVVSFTTPVCKIKQSSYIVHPVALDSCFQAGAPSLWQGHRSAVGKLLIPALLDELTILAHDAPTEAGIACAHAKWTGEGRVEDSKRYKSIVNVFDQQTGQMVLRVNGLRYHSIDSSVQRAPPVFLRLQWNPDISFMTQEQLREQLASAPDAPSKIAHLANMMAFKNPRIKLLEARLDDASSIWAGQAFNKMSEIVSDCHFHLSLPNHAAVNKARKTYENYVGFSCSARTDEDLFSNIEGKHDLIIISGNSSSASLRPVIEAASKIIAEDGYLAVVVEGSMADVRPRGFKAIMNECSDDPHVAFLGSLVSQNATKIQDSKPKIHLVHFEEHEEARSISDALKTFGWQPESLTMPLTKELSKEDTVLVVDEIFAPILTRINEKQFAAFQSILASKCRLLWVTRGSQMVVTEPESGAIFGALRAIHAEDPNHLVMAVDIEGQSGNAAIKAVNASLERLLEVEETLEFSDREFVEREGLINICRVLPDKAVNLEEASSKRGAELVDLKFHQHKNPIGLVTDNPGSLNSVYWLEKPELAELGPNNIEIDVHATALNFKDVANAMGFVAANEYQIGFECAGVVTRVGSNCQGRFKPGDRVAGTFLNGGSFANRVQNALGAFQMVPDWMSLDGAATLAVCCNTVIYAVKYIANAKRGQTVLIHSASGGVGLAGIQLCRYWGLPFWVTVGTQEKRDFLNTEYGVPYERMFNSRSVNFADELMEATEGRGVDIIINSLTGDMLHETWRCIADGGYMIEIGKKDILDRNQLSLEPFSRCAHYTAFDLTHPSLTDELMATMLAETFELAAAGHIKPLHICKTFRWDEIHDAMRFMRDGKHFGKVVVSSSVGDRETLTVPVRPALRQLKLRSDSSYLIAGGLKGLCGSLAIYMARHGATNLVVMSRSGCSDELSQSVLHHCSALGTHVEFIQGDITNINDVRRCFASAPKPIVGIIQGAMVLRDKMLNHMTHQEFREPLAPKVEGTWNLHNVSLEQDTPLDFFTMLSSVSGLAGQAAQVNYSAGNVFQDSLSVYRQSMGLKACAVNLGYIEGVGYFVERDEISRRLESKGWPPINEPLLHKILKYSFFQQSQNPINPDSTFQFVSGIPVPLTSTSPMQAWQRFSALRPGVNATADGGARGDANLALLKSIGKGGEADDVEALAAAVVCLNATLVRSLGLKEPMEELRPLSAYGIDSLVAVELRNWVRGEFGIELSALDVVSAKTLTALGEVLLKKLKK